MLTIPLNNHVAKNGVTKVNLFLCRSADGIHAPTEAF